MMLPSTSVRGENPENRENQTEPNQKSDGQLLKRLSSLLEQPAHILNLLPYPRLNEVPRAGHELGSAGAEIPSDPCTGEGSGLVGAHPQGSGFGASFLHSLDCSQWRGFISSGRSRGGSRNRT